jgi:hypothetical protein
LDRHKPGGNRHTSDGLRPPVVDRFIKVSKIFPHERDTYLPNSYIIRFGNFPKYPIRYMWPHSSKRHRAPATRITLNGLLPVIAAAKPPPCAAGPHRSCGSCAYEPCAPVRDFRALIRKAPAIPSEPADSLPAMPLGEHVLTDYATVRMSLKAHPMAVLRDEFARLGYVQTKDLAALPANRMLRVAGIVLIRQRPGSANG